MGRTISIQYVTDAAGNRTAVQIPIKDWSFIEKEVTELLKKRPSTTSTKSLASLLAEGYLATKEEDYEIMEDFQIADFENED